MLIIQSLFQYEYLSSKSRLEFTLALHDEEVRSTFRTFVPVDLRRLGGAPNRFARS